MYLEKKIYDSILLKKSDVLFNHFAVSNPGNVTEKMVGKKKKQR